MRRFLVGSAVSFLLLAASAPVAAQGIFDRISITAPFIGGITFDGTVDLTETLPSFSIDLTDRISFIRDDELVLLADGEFEFRFVEQTTATGETIVALEGRRAGETDFTLITRADPVTGERTPLNQLVQGDFLSDELVFGGKAGFQLHPRVQLDALVAISAQTESDIFPQAPTSVNPRLIDLRVLPPREQIPREIDFFTFQASANFNILTGPVRPYVGVGGGVVTFNPQLRALDFEAEVQSEWSWNFGGGLEVFFLDQFGLMAEVRDIVFTINRDARTFNLGEFVGQDAGRFLFEELVAAGDLPSTTEVERNVRALTKQQFLTSSREAIDDALNEVRHNVLFYAGFTFRFAGP